MKRLIALIAALATIALIGLASPAAAAHPAAWLGYYCMPAPDQGICVDLDPVGFQYQQGQWVDQLGDCVTIDYKSTGVSSLTTASSYQQPGGTPDPAWNGQTVPASGRRNACPPSGAVGQFWLYGFELTAPDQPPVYEELPIYIGDPYGTHAPDWTSWRCYSPGVCARWEVEGQPHTGHGYVVKHVGSCVTIAWQTKGFQSVMAKSTFDGPDGPSDPNWRGQVMADNGSAQACPDEGTPGQFWRYLLVGWTAQGQPEARGPRVYISHS